MDKQNLLFAIMKGLRGNKIKSLQETITKFESKWELSFEEFKKKINDKTLKKDTYSFDVEQDFWLWEEAETLKKHYESLKKG